MRSRKKRRGKSVSLYFATLNRLNWLTVADILAQKIQWTLNKTPNQTYNLIPARIPFVGIPIYSTPASWIR